MVLLRVLVLLGYCTEAAHMNFQLRGAASASDEALVRDLCRQWAICLHVAPMETAALASSAGESVQMAARRLRYAFFQRVATERGLTHVAAGHHMDDQVETVLQNLIRGTGPEGLAGMSSSRPLEAGSSIVLIRPLLHVRRREIVSFARSEGLQWHEDISNTDAKYARSRLRCKVVPAIEEAFGSAASVNIARSSNLMRAYVGDTLLPLAEELFDRTACVGRHRLDIRILQDCSSIWRRRIILEALRRWLPLAPATAGVAERAERLVAAQPGRRMELGRGIIWRDRDSLVFAAARPVTQPVRLEYGETALLSTGLLRVELLDTGRCIPAAGVPLVAHMDADRLKGELVARTWKSGDRLRPLGMQGTKKVSDILTDAKVPVAERKDMWVVTCGPDIAWVVGLRLAAAFQVLPTTRKIARLSFSPVSDNMDHGGKADSD